MQDVLQPGCGLGCFETHLELPLILYIYIYFFQLVGSGYGRIITVCTAYTCKFLIQNWLHL